jgi:hypothetical protein
MNRATAPARESVGLGRGKLAGRMSVYCLRICDLIRS